MAVSPVQGVDLCEKPIGETTKHRPNFCAESVKPDKNLARGEKKAGVVIAEGWAVARSNRPDDRSGVPLLLNSTAQCGHGSRDEPEFIIDAIDPGAPPTAGPKASKKSRFAGGAESEAVRE
jgi:hypothetical protein